jgi:tight adherence protein C
MTLVLAASSVLFGLGAYISIGILRESGRSRRIQRRVAAAVAVAGPRSANDELQSSPAVRLGRRLLRRSGEYQEAAKLVRGAGYFGNDAPYRFAYVRLGLGLVFGLAAVAAYFLHARVAGHGVAALIGGATAGVAVGYLGPRFVVGRIAAARRQELFHEMPLFLDTFLLLLRSGASIEQCFRYVAQWGADTLPEIHLTVLALVEDIDQGRGYQDALARWKERMGVDAADEVTGFLHQSLVHGTELSAPLGYFSTRLIAKRLLEARALAGRRTTQVTVAMMIFLMPPLIIVIGAPAFSAVFQSFSLK